MPPSTAPTPRAGTLTPPPPARRWTPTDDRTDRRRRRFASRWAALDASVDEQVRPAKEDLLVDLPAEVVELGSGCGANFPYLPPGTRVVAFEPNRHFHERLRAAAEAHDLVLEHRTDDLRDAGLESDSVSLVLCTLVLCSVDDPPSMLDEVHRILRPGGRLLFIEHVAEPDGTARAWYQRLVRRPWMALADRCDPRAHTDEHLADSRFRLGRTRLEHLGSGLDPTNLVYWGEAIKD